MQTHQKNNYEYFWDKYEKHWVLYPIDSEWNRIEWDNNDKPIESQYFNNKTELTNFLKNQN